MSFLLFTGEKKKKKKNKTGDGKYSPPFPYGLLALYLVSLFLLQFFNSRPPADFQTHLLISDKKGHTGFSQNDSGNEGGGKE